MIRSVRANKATFRPVTFKPGFNVILADRTDKSQAKDSRNGLGKSTLVDIIKFSLGSFRNRGQGLLRDELAGWEFTVEFDLAGESLTVTRGVDEPGRAVLRWRGEVRTLIDLGWENDEAVVRVDRLDDLFGKAFFDLPQKSAKYSPSFRSLLNYFVRRSEGFTTPFEHHRKQTEWDKQLHNAYLLDLDWEIAVEWQLLKDRKKSLGALRKAMAEGELRSLLGTTGELEAERVTLARRVTEREAALAEFRVHPRYEELEREVNEITNALHEEANRNFVDTRLLGLYERGIEQEAAPDVEVLESLYEEVGVALPDVAQRTLAEAASFHAQVVENRRSFLAQELDRLRRATEARRHRIRELDVERARLMATLDSHGALEEFRQLQDQLSEELASLRDIEARVERAREIEEGEDRIAIELGLLQQRARLSFEERRTRWEQAIALFGAHTEALYAVPGRLIIDITPTGYRFQVEIERADSEGVSKMKVFCYDLVLAELWADKPRTPGFLIHDSALFDGVDERQVALALRLARDRAETSGFQYICMLNTDDVPTAELKKLDFNLASYERLTLTDESEAGMLLGIKF